MTRKKINGIYKDDWDRCTDLLIRLNPLPALTLAYRAVNHAAGQVYLISDYRKLLRILEASDELIGRIEEMKKQIKRRLRIVHGLKISYDEDILYFTNIHAKHSDS